MQFKHRFTSHHIFFQHITKRTNNPSQFMTLPHSFWHRITLNYMSTHYITFDYNSSHLMTSQYITSHNIASHHITSQGQLPQFETVWLVVFSNIFETPIFFVFRIVKLQLSLPGFWTWNPGEKRQIIDAQLSWLKHATFVIA